MSELKVTWKHIGSIGWAMLWRSILGGVALGAVGGFIVGLVDALIVHRGPNPIAAAITGWLFAFPWYFVALRMALMKHYRGFRVTLVPTDLAPINSNGATIPQTVD
jgi:hypothetical protein